MLPLFAFSAQLGLFTESTCAILLLSSVPPTLHPSLHCILLCLVSLRVCRMQDVMREACVHMSHCISSGYKLGVNDASTGHTQFSTFHHLSSRFCGCKKESARRKTFVLQCRYWLPAKLAIYAEVSMGAWCFILMGAGKKQGFQEVIQIMISLVIPGNAGEHVISS